MILVVNLYILLVYCCTLLLNFTFYFFCQPLFYDSGGQPLKFSCLLLYYAVYWCTVHAESVMQHAWLMLCPSPTPIVKMFILSEMKMKDIDRKLVYHLKDDL